MPRPDKLPYLDPNIRGIFDRIVATAASERLRRKSDEYRKAEERREAAAVHLRALKEREEREVAAELLRQQATTKKDPTFTYQRPFLSLR